MTLEEYLSKGYRELSIGELIQEGDFGFYLRPCEIFDEDKHILISEGYTRPVKKCINFRYDTVRFKQFFDKTSFIILTKRPIEPKKEKTYVHGM